MSTVPTPAQDVVVLLQRLTNFMALRDPELLAAAAAAVGADTLIPLFQETSRAEGSDDHGLPIPDSQPQRFDAQPQIHGPQLQCGA